MFHHGQDFAICLHDLGFHKYLVPKVWDIYKKKTKTKQWGWRYFEMAKGGSNQTSRGSQGGASVECETMHESCREAWSSCA